MDEGEKDLAAVVLDAWRSGKRKEHLTDGTPCWCDPVVEGHVVRHRC